MPLLALRPRDHTKGLAASNDGCLLHPVFGLEVPGDDGVTGLVIRDGAFVVRAHLRDRLLESKEPHIGRREPVLVAELVPPVFVGDDERFVDDRSDVDRGPTDRVLRHHVDVAGLVVRFLAEVVLKDVLSAFAIRRMHDKGAVQPAWSHERLIEHVRSVRRSHDEDKRLRRNRAADDPEPAAHAVLPAVFEVLTERVHLVQQRVEAHTAHAAHHSADGHLHLAAHHTAAGHADRIDLVDEEDRRPRMSRLRVLAREGPGLSEERHDDERVDAPEHASKTRRVDVNEWQLRLGGDDARQERLTGAGLS